MTKGDRTQQSAAPLLSTTDRGTKIYNEKTHVSTETKCCLLRKESSLSWYCHVLLGKHW